MGTKYDKLKRPLNPMPDFVMEAMKKNNVVEAYFDRPAYQQNDYIGWIMRGKREATRQKRLDQMIYELKRGDVYMKMAYKTSP